MTEIDSQEQTPMLKLKASDVPGHPGHRTSEWLKAAMQLQPGEAVSFAQIKPEAVANMHSIIGGGRRRGRVPKGVKSRALRESNGLIKFYIYWPEEEGPA